MNDPQQGETWRVDDDDYSFWVGNLRCHVVAHHGAINRDREIRDAILKARAEAQSALPGMAALAGEIASLRTQLKADAQEVERLRTALEQWQSNHICQECGDVGRAALDRTLGATPRHVSQLDSQELLRLSEWFHAKGQNLVDELMKTAGSLTPEQEAVANGD